MNENVDVWGLGSWFSSFCCLNYWGLKEILKYRNCSGWKLIVKEMNNSWFVDGLMVF